MNNRYDAIEKAYGIADLRRKRTPFTKSYSPNVECAKHCKRWTQWRSLVWLLLLITAVGVCAGCDAPQAAQAGLEGSQESTETALSNPVPDTAEAERDPNRMWCGEHSVYEDECVICHPEIATKQEAGETAPCCPVPDAAEAERDPNRMWCGEHSVYEDECVICHPEIASGQDTADSTSADNAKDAARDPNRLWCGEHSVYEDECVICHPEIASGQNTADSASADNAKDAARDPNRLWCARHAVYEDECLLCHPELAEQEQASGTTPQQALFCNEHGVAERECGICQPQLLASLAPGQGLKVRLPSKMSVTKAGINIGRPGAGRTETAPDFLGQVSFDKNKLAVVSPLGAGVLQEIFVDVGEAVEAGQLLAVVTASSLSEAKDVYVSALAEIALRRETFKREKDLHEKEISARQDYEKAKAALTASESAVAHARQRLMDLGLREEDVKEVARSRSTDSTLAVRAPFKGTIVERDAVVGTLVNPGASLFLVADLSTMWMELSIPETQLTSVKKGALVQVRFDALPGLAFEGEITWIAYRVDNKTRMVQARAVLPNAQQLLKDGLFGSAQLSGFSQTAGLVVPNEAVQIVDGRPVVFAKLEEDLFEVRTITLGGARNGSTAVLAGLSITDEIVLNESYILKSEFLKARLGAGCTDH